MEEDNNGGPSNEVPMDEGVSDSNQPSEDIIERVPTGIPGFDDMVCGGFERGSTVLLVGGSGSGKTKFAMQYLIDGAVKYGEKGIYISFEEKADKLKKHMKVFGWDLDKLEEEGLIKILSIMPEDTMKLIKEGYGDIVGTITEMNVKRIAVDSITTIEAMIESPYERKRNILRMIDRLDQLGCTSVFLSEYNDSPDKYQKYGLVEFLADAVIILYNIQKGNIRESALEVLKMRGTNHLKKIVPFKFDKGIRVFPHEQVFDNFGQV